MPYPMWNANVSSRALSLLQLACCRLAAAGLLQLRLIQSCVSSGRNGLVRWVQVGPVRHP